MITLNEHIQEALSKGNIISNLDIMFTKGCTLTKKGKFALYFYDSFGYAENKIGSKTYNTPSDAMEDVYNELTNYSEMEKDDYWFCKIIDCTRWNGKDVELAEVAIIKLIN